MVSVGRIDQKRLRGPGGSEAGQEDRKWVDIGHRPDVDSADNRRA